MTNLPRPIPALSQWYRNTLAVSALDSPYGEKLGSPSDPAPSPSSNTLPVRSTRLQPPSRSARSTAARLSVFFWTAATASKDGLL
jgi:hypothetical protein